MKKKFGLLCLVMMICALCATLSACSLFGGIFNKDGEQGSGQTQETDAFSKAELISFGGSVPEGNEVNIATTGSYVINVSEIIEVSKYASWQIYFDEDCTDLLTAQALMSKGGGPLENGNNIFYIQVTSGNKSTTNVYKLTVYRRIQLSVGYYDGDTLLKSETVYSGLEFAADYVPEFTGYTFRGWVDEEGNDFSPCVLFENINLFVKKTVNTYKVTLDVNGGEPIEVTEHEVTYDSRFTLPVTERFGYTFDGWYYADNWITDKFGDSNGKWSLAENVTLKARWIPNRYMLTLQSDDSAAGTVSGGGLQYYDAGVEISAVPNDGYTFLGWYDGEDLLTMDTRYEFVMGTARTITAKWGLFRLTFASETGGSASVSHTVEFDLNGGQGTAPATQYVTDYRPLKYPSEQPTRNGYIFRGWFTKSVISNTDAPYDFSNNLDSDITLYAGWFKRPETDEGSAATADSRITFDLRGSSPDKRKSMTFCAYTTGIYTVNYETPIMDFLFVKVVVNVINLTTNETLFTDSFNDTNKHSRDISVRAGNAYCVEIYRERERNDEDFYATVTLSSNGAKPWDGGVPTVPSETPTRAGTTYTLMAEADEGYEFLGWYDESGELLSTELVFEFTMPYSTIVVTAKWRPISETAL